MNNSNELQTLETEIQHWAAEVQIVYKRQEELKTEKGRLRAEAEILNCLQALAGYGYKAGDFPQDQRARLWERGLEEYIATYGMDVIKKAVKTFAENDEREYREFPTIPDIKAVCRQLGKNPKAEYEKRRQEILIAQMKAEREEQLKQWLTPEKEKELDEEYERRFKNE